MSARPRKPRVCGCAAPIPYRDLGEPAACAKCGHRLAGGTREAPGVVAAEVAGPPATGRHRGGWRPATSVSRERAERHASQVGIATAPTDDPFEWPFTAFAAARQADPPLEGAG